MAPAWPDDKLISSPSSSYDFFWELAGEVVLWICVPFFLPLPGAAAKNWQQSKACAYVVCRALKLWCFWKSKCWLYISLLWTVVRRLLTLSTAELMTGGCRVKFACSVSVSDCSLETLLWGLVIHPDKSEKETSCLVLKHGCFSAWTVDLCVLGWFQQVIASSEGQLLTLHLVLVFLSFHVQFQG